MKKIILASSSPRRKELLEGLGLTIKVIPSRIEEKMNPRLGPHAQARQLSLQKALAVAEKSPKESVIIAADTIVVLDGEQIGKPESLTGAKRMLKKLQGRTQLVVTGYTVMDTDTRKMVTDSAESKIWMRKLTSREIDSYIQKEQVLDKAGGYAMQGIGTVLFERIEGDYFNVVGLPLFKLAATLKRFGVTVL